ncbi:N-acetylglucosamine kinase [uncultured Dysosmobacter sp.]|uniref:N-acetylglucosamine kinase n=1 Tax=uncultured Dysosmobacter sp. TaxID=2591384 RepID=UPI0026322DA1|nr:BadF/BadG/BcrA/BcrD ATPase family protein [uncultured Dysosmobacter sp.]
MVVKALQPEIFGRRCVLLEYFIAIDGGGTKTETLLFDEAGHILCRDVTTGCNALDIGSEAAKDLLLQAIGRVRRCVPGKVSAVFGGIAGNCHCGHALYKALRTQLDVEKLEIWDDTYSVISSVLGHQDGCGLVAGTGSSLFVRAEGKPCIHIGGWGYLIDTGGSGFDLGCEAVYMALRAIDGRGEKTVLNELLHRTLHKPVEESIVEIYAGGRPFIASLAYTVFEGRRMGDAVCEKIFAHGINHLAEMVSTAAKYYEDQFTVVLGGGLFSANPEYVEALRAVAPPQAKLLTTDMPVVYGAAIEALRMAGRTAALSFKQTFFEDYMICRQCPDKPAGKGTSH